MPRDRTRTESDGTTVRTPTTTQRVRAALSGPRLLGGMLLLLLVPGSLAVGALNYHTPEPAPPALIEPLDTSPQIPDSVARAQLDRDAQANRLSRKLATPELLDPSRTGTTPSLPSLAVAPRPAPYTLAELRKLVPAAFSEVPGAAGAVLVNANIDVPVGATLVLDGQTPDIRLASSHAGFATLISRGTVQVTGSDDAAVQVSSWDVGRGAADTDVADGRSFVLQVGGRMDVDHARFSYLGFGTGTSSGVAWRGASDANGTDWVKTHGTATSSVFTHNHFGAYTHQAENMLWENNTFVANEEYGFDPHDFSTGFLVTGNTANDNGKHGFIFSRGCDDNVLRANFAHDNKGHGFMIDDGRSAQTADAESRVDTSDRNLVTANVAYDNGISGVEIEGGTGNVVSANQLMRNDIGVRIKDRASATVADNTIVDSGRYGINVLDTGGQIPLTGNRISGSWAAINVETPGAATVGVNPTADVTTPLVVGGVVTYETTWVDEVAKFVRWNPVLVLWGLILGVPFVVGVFHVLESPFLLHRRYAAHR